jgi:anaerobic selenocysteine-containing dehydrogenase
MATAAAPVTATAVQVIPAAWAITMPLAMIRPVITGMSPFVPVSWERALELVAGELGRVRREHGPSAIMGGSQGWSSAGHFHEARGQLRRFLAASGGFVDQTSNYSFGTALTALSRQR